MTNPSDATRVLLLCGAILDGDLVGARELLAAGCPTSLPGLVTNPLPLAIERGRKEIIRALVDAGARMEQADFYVLVRPMLRAGKTDAAEHAARCGVVDDLEQLFLTTITDQQEALALILLDMGISPLVEHRIPGGARVTAFECATWSRTGMPNLITAMMATMTLQQKNNLLQDLVRKGRGAGVRSLLSAGADAHQIINGRNLIDLTPDDADDVRRMLRSVETTESIEAAMGGGDAPPATPTRPSFTL